MTDTAAVPSPPPEIAPRPAQPQTPAPGGASAKPPATVQERPAQVLKRYYRNVSRGRLDAALSMQYRADPQRAGSASGRATQQSLQDLQQDLRRNGGIESLKVTSERIAGNKAELVVTRTMANGAVYVERRELVNDDGRWKVSGAAAKVEQAHTPEAVASAPVVPRTPAPAAPPKVDSGATPNQAASAEPPEPKTVFGRIGQFLRREKEKLERCQGKWGTTPDCPANQWYDKKGPLE
jgi:hypothetical protein